MGSRHECTAAASTVRDRSVPGPWATATKGLAIAMVVAFHATLYLQGAGLDVLLGRAKAAFELFPMPAFFLIVGMAAASHRRMTLGTLWWRRLLPLLYLYVLWSLIRTVFYLVVPGLDGGMGDLSATDPRALLLLLVWPSSSYWFLWALMVFTLVRWLIAPAPVWLQLAGSAVLSTLFTSRLLDAGNIGLDRVGGLLFFFVAGAVLAQPIKAAVARVRPRDQLVLLLAIALITLGLLTGLRWLPFLALAGQVAAVALGITLCARLRPGRVRRVLTALGDETFIIYLVHLFLIVPVAALVAASDPQWPRWLDAGVQAALGLGALAGSYAVARLVRRVRWLYMPPAWMLPARRTARPTPPPGSTARRASDQQVTDAAPAADADAADAAGAAPEPAGSATAGAPGSADTRRSTRPPGR